MVVKPKLLSKAVVLKTQAQWFCALDTVRRNSRTALEKDYN